MIVQIKLTVFIIREKLMFKLFRIEDVTNQPIQIAPDWNYVKTNMMVNVKRAKQYYRDSSFSVPSQHFLVRLLQSIPVPKNTEIDSYYRAVNDIALSHSSSMQMTSAYYRGKFFSGVAYGKQSLECLLVVDDLFNYKKAHENWQDIVAVRPIMHDKSDFSVSVPNSIDYSNELSSSVLLINLPLLAIQYRAFYLENTNNHNKNYNKTIMHFVGQYVLPNMLEDHIDLCLINRLINKHLGLQQSISVIQRYPFAMINLENQIDLVLDKVLDYIKKAPKRFDLVLKTIPSFSKENAYKVLLMPDISTTKQVHWAGMWARLKYMAFLCDIADKEVLKLNQSEINEIIMELNYGDLYNVFRSNLPIELFFKAQGYLDTIAKNLSNPTAFKH